MGFWDSAFSAPGYKYGEAPNAFLASQEPRFTRGSRVLVPGDGEGRNGVWLAERGHLVTTIDASQVGVEKARALAAARGVSLHIQLGDLEAFAPEPARVDVVASIYLHLPAPLRRRVHQRLLAALAPGGWFLLEAFHPQQLGRPSGGPKDVAMLYTSADILGDIAAVGTEQFEIIDATETETTLDEGPGHRGPAVVTRIVARRLAQ